MDINYVDSSKARENFFKILNSVCKDKKTYVIEKSGIPVAKISCVDEAPKRSFREFAGILTDAEAKRMLKLVKTGRNDGSAKKKYLLKW